MQVGSERAGRHSRHMGKAAAHLEGRDVDATGHEKFCHDHVLPAGSTGQYTWHLLDMLSRQICGMTRLRQIWCQLRLTDPASPVRQKSRQIHLLGLLPPALPTPLQCSPADPGMVRGQQARLCLEGKAPAWRQRANRISLAALTVHGITWLLKGGECRTAKDTIDRGTGSLEGSISTWVPRQ